MLQQRSHRYNQVNKKLYKTWYLGELDKLREVDGTEQVGDRPRRDDVRLAEENPRLRVNNNSNLGLSQTERSIIGSCTRYRSPDRNYKNRFMEV